MHRIVDWLFRNRETGKITIWQWPNIPLWVFLVARVAQAIFDGSWLGVVATIALVIWALLELVKGVNPFRRLLGLAVLIGLILR